MRRLGRLAPVLAAAVLVLRAAPARAEPLDVDLAKLGPPDPAVWVRLGDIQSPGSIGAAAAAGLASEAKQRFAVLSSEVALAMSSALLQPASTTGHSGFDVAAEGTYSAVHGGALGTAPLGFSSRPWPTNSVTPSSLMTSGVHVRKALPFSFEVGGRLTNIAMTSYFAAQGEAKWALNEGFDYIPDIAVRGAYTRLFGQRTWNLAATDLDVMISKRWGVSGVTSFTPYAAARFTFLNASSQMLDFGPYRSGPGGPGPNDGYSTVAAFPTLRVGLYRTTAGVRMTANAVSLAAEATYFGGTKYAGKAAPTRDEYGDFELGSSFSAALKLGWEF
ncbi:MAG TPA: hypothetical protein VIW03_08225 [Anaeromyxobacter sp.]